MLATHRARIAASARLPEGDVARRRQADRAEGADSAPAPGPQDAVLALSRPRTLLRVAVVFLGLAALLHVALTRRWTWDHVVGPHNEALARLCAWLLSPFVDHVEARGTLVRADPFEIELVAGCDGFDAMAILLSGVLAFPATWRARAKGLAIGIPILFAANLGRILVLFPLGLHAPRLFDMVHVYVFQVFIVAVAAGCFLWWAAQVALPARAGPTPPAEAGA
jgi:exosortase H (IPTLxxWG-CTERM-specific)